MKQIRLFTFLIVFFTVFQPIRAAIDLDSLKQDIIQNSKEIQEQRKDSILFSKLTSEQIMELKRNDLQVKQKEIESRVQSDMPLNAFAIVMIVLIPFLTLILAILIVGNVRNRESERKHMLYLKSLEMGQAIPDHFFDTPKKPKNESNLKTGIILLAIGLGFTTLYVFVQHEIAIMLGIFLAFLGIGYLLVHLLDKPKKVDEQNG